MRISDSDCDKHDSFEGDFLAALAGTSEPHSSRGMLEVKKSQTNIEKTFRGNVNQKTAGDLYYEVLVTDMLATTLTDSQSFREFLAYVCTLHSLAYVCTLHRAPRCHPGKS